MTAVSGYVLAESMRPGTTLEGLPLELRRIERSHVPTAGPDQPSVWTAIEFEFRAEHAERVAEALSNVLEERGGWYSDFRVGDETFVIYAHRIFRYRTGDEAARAEAEAYGRRVGVPDTQLDWAE